MAKENTGILIFAGTTEGRELAEYAAEQGISCYVSTATEYGKSLVDAKDGVEVLSGRMDKAQIADFLGDRRIGFVIDATHPFAREVTENIRKACEEMNAAYVRFLREKERVDGEDVVLVDSIEEAVEFLRETSGNILITTGSKELYRYTEIDGYRERCFARVLSTKEAVAESVRLGFEGRHLTAMQGPFSAEMNLALLHQTKARYFVTKESGRVGGFDEKLEAARAADAVLVVIGRPLEEGEPLEEIKKRMRDFALDRECTVANT